MSPLLAYFLGIATVFVVPFVWFVVVQVCYVIARRARRRKINNAIAKILGG